MTSGDGERVAPPPEMAADSTTSGAVSAAALCYDSDDLLTQRRGGLPADRARATNGHTDLPDTAEPDVAGPQFAEADDAAPPPSAAPASVDDASPEPPVEDVPAVGSAASEMVTEPGPFAEPEHSNGTVAVLAPPTVAEQPIVAVPAIDDEAPLPSTPIPSDEAEDADEASSVGAMSAAAQPQDPTLDPAPVASTPGETASSAAQAPDEASPTADGLEPEVEEAPVPPAPLTTAARPAPPPVDPVTPTVPTVATNGFAHHAAETAEFTPVASDEATEPVDTLPPAPDIAQPPADEMIEIPMPVVSGEEQQTLGISGEMAMDAPMGAVSAPEDTLTLAAEPTTIPEAAGAETAVLTEPDLPTIPPVAPPAPPVAATPPPPPSAPPPDEGEEEGATMTIIEHLEELRHRITVSAISIVVGAVLGWFIVPHVVQYLEHAAQKIGGKFFSPTILGPFGLELKLSFLIGLIIASPVVLFQVWGFIAPGLTRREKRYALPFSLIGSGLFAAGAVTGILIVPLAIQFLTHFFAVLDLEQLLDIDKYIMFIALIAVIFGITFELPIFMVGFSLLGVVTSRYFIQKFRIAIFIIFGVSMVITPGADLISPLVLGGFLTVLYWFGVLLIRIIGR